MCKKNLLLVCLMVLFGSAGYGQDTLAIWAFNDLTLSGTASTVPVLATGSANADRGTVATYSSFSALHASASTVWSTPAGQGTPSTSLSANNWTVGDYFQFQTVTTGYSSIQLSINSYGSGTGPKDFKVQYSTDGSEFTDVPGGAYTNDVASNWKNSTFDLTSVTSLNNLSSIYIRLVNTSTVSINNGTVATAGTSRIDNIAILGTSETTTPVSFASFTSTLLSGKIKLDWTSAVESNTSYFSVEKSTDAKSWAAIDKVTAKGSNSSYSSVDPSPVTGTNYYRIAGFDLDSSVKYSPVISKEFAGRSAFALTPNPAVGGKTKITFAAPAATGTVVKLVDISGRTVSTAVVTAGTLQYDLDVSKLPSGIYIAVVATGTEVLSSAKLLVP